MLLIKGEWTAIAQTLFCASIGACLLAGSTKGWFGGKLAMPLRVVLFVAALCLLHPGTETDLIGFGVGVPIYLWQRLRARAPAAPA